jgi:hypothetical protein
MKFARLLVVVVCMCTGHDCLGIRVLELTSNICMLGISRCSSTFKAICLGDPQSEDHVLWVVGGKSRLGSSDLGMFRPRQLAPRRELHTYNLCDQITRRDT